MFSLMRFKTKTDDMFPRVEMVDCITAYEQERMIYEKDSPYPVIIEFFCANAVKVVFIPFCLRLRHALIGTAQSGSALKIAQMRDGNYN